MKKKHSIYILITLIIAVAAWAVGYAASGIRVKDVSVSIPGDAVYMRCRIISIVEDGSVLLAEHGGNDNIYSQNISDIPIQYEDPSVSALTAGMMVEIAYGGTILESEPGIIGNIYMIHVLSDEMDTLCVQYLQVLNDLWEESPGVNTNLQHLGVDLSQTSLTKTEQWAVAWQFGNQHGLIPIYGTFDELVSQGYIDDEKLEWRDGCLFSITETHAEDDRITFSAEKWWSGLGADFWDDCTIRQNADGIWGDYTIGSVAIS